MYVLLKMGICPRENWDLPLLCYSTRRYLVVCRERGSELGNTCSEENYRQVPGSVHLIEQTTRLWFQLCFFSPLFVEDSHFDKKKSLGLKHHLENLID